MGLPLYDTVSTTVHLRNMYSINSNLDAGREQKGFLSFFRSLIFKFILPLDISSSSFGVDLGCVVVVWKLDDVSLG